jgi:hypothetical protein
MTTHYMSLFGWLAADWNWLTVLVTGSVLGIGNRASKSK